MKNKKGLFVASLVLVGFVGFTRSLLADGLDIGDPFAELTNPSPSQEEANADPFANWSQGTYESQLVQDNADGTNHLFMGFGVPVINTGGQEFQSGANGNLFLGHSISQEEAGIAPITAEPMYQSSYNLFLNTKTDDIFDSAPTGSDASVVEQTQALSDRYWRSK